MADATSSVAKVGILAYGSLISDPRVEIENACTDVIDDIMIPFAIEFARSSNGRGGAPTLVPVTSGGKSVKGKIFVMDVVEQEASDILYRREIGQVGDMARTYKRPREITDNTVLVERLTNFAGLDVVLFTKIASTIAPLTAEHLAELATASVAKAKPGLDGVSYLMAAKEHGIETALSAEYESAILRKTDCGCLLDARERLLAVAAEK